MVSMDQMEGVAQALADAVDRALPGWVTAAVGSRIGGPLPPATAEAAQRARAEIVPRLRALLSADVDEQRTSPLTVLRDAVRYPTEVLRAAGVEPAERDDFERERFPDDVYGLVPAAFADFGPEVAAAGIAWGAAKAWTHRKRHGG